MITLKWAIREVDPQLRVTLTPILPQSYEEKYYENSGKTHKRNKFCYQTKTINLLLKILQWKSLQKW